MAINGEKGAAPRKIMMYDDGKVHCSRKWRTVNAYGCGEPYVSPAIRKNIFHQRLLASDELMDESMNGWMNE